LTLVFAFCACSGNAYQTLYNYLDEEGEVKEWKGDVLYSININDDDQIELTYVDGTVVCWITVDEDGEEHEVWMGFQFDDGDMMYGEGTIDGEKFHKNNKIYDLDLGHTDPYIDIDYPAAEFEQVFETALDMLLEDMVDIVEDLDIGITLEDLGFKDYN